MPVASNRAQFQRLADQDHCIPPISSPPPTLVVTSGSSSTTMDDDDMMSMNELRVEMETLLSLRRRSMNQPLPNDPDLPPTSPPTSSPPTASSPNPPSSSSASDSPHIVVAAADADPANKDTVGNNPSSSRRRPHLTLQLAPPSTTTIDTAGGGPPISPTAPSPAETGTLVRRRSTANPKLPSQYPLPVPPLPSPSSLSPTGLQLSPFFGGGPPQAAEASSSSGSTSSPPTSPTTSYLDIPLSSVGLTSSSSSSTADNGGGGGELFWLPASLHPELAPQEFKAFIREHTTPEALARRRSLSSSSLGSDGQVGGGGGRTTTTTTTTTNRRISRRASLLRGEYKPRQGDGVGGDREGGANDLKRTTSDGNRRGVGGGPAGGFRRGGVLNFEQLTIKDLQRLEELATKAEAEGTTAGEEEEGERLGRVLRRSLSLNPHRVAAAAAAAAAADAEKQHQQQQQPLHAPGTSPERLSSLSEESAAADDEAPLIVPPPGQILRRNARTRIRKSSTGSDFGPGGSRFGGPRRQRTSTGGGGSESIESSHSNSGGGVVDNLRASTTSSVYGGTVEDDGQGSSVGDHSMEDSSVFSYEGESDEAGGGGGGGVRGGVRAPPPSVESSSETAAYASVVPVSSPTSSESHQHIEFSSPAVVYEEAPERQHTAPALGTPAPSSQQQPVVTALPASRDSTEPPPPALPERPTVSPASADYDWATHNLQGGPLAPSPSPPPPPPPPPPAAVEPQYHVHPQHLSRQPFSEVPPVQAVPVPTYDRDSLAGAAAAPPSPSSSSSLPSRAAESPKPSGGKEKKSGWARLGLGGRDDDKGKKKGRSASSSSSTKEDSKESSASGFLGGLFGRKHREEHDRPPPRAPSPPPEPKIPPPPPTASGVLLPNGRYANFYRLPIHVERAVYRLSHIKLANPRRPLYEQVLISNLMFWYLGLIQKPTTPPPPAAPPVPIPGMRAQQQQQQQQKQQQQQQAQVPPPVAPLAVPAPAPVPKESPKRAGLSKPGRGGRTAETPIRATSFEVQNQQLVEEQQHHRYQQRQQEQPRYAPLQTSHASSPNGRDPPTSPPGKGIFAPPLSSSKTVEQPPPSRSPDRASAPANMYPISSSHATGYEPATANWQHEQQDQPPQHRESYPPNRPVPVMTDSMHVDSTGFEVTSRSPAGGRLSSGSSHSEAFLMSSSDSPSTASASARERRASTMSDKSFDASEIYDAYGVPASPVNISADGVGDPFASGTANATAANRPAGLVLGAVAPRGSSLKALSGS